VGFNKPAFMVDPNDPCAVARSRILPCFPLLFLFPSGKSNPVLKYTYFSRFFKEICDEAVISAKCYNKELLLLNTMHTIESMCINVNKNNISYISHLTSRYEMPYPIYVDDNNL